MSNRLVVIVGATGVLGRSLVPLLVEQGERVRALARSAGQARELFGPEVEALDFDLLDPSAETRLPGLLNGADALVHIATAIPSDSSRPGAWDANTRLRTTGTRLLLDAALAAGVTAYIQQSITMAYPDCGEVLIDESQSLDRSPERAGVCGPVIAMEEMVRALPPGRVRWCILRGGSFVGKGTFQDRTIALLRAGRLRVACNGLSFASYIHVDDMASALAAALRRGPSGSTFNICAAPIREGEYLDRLAELAGASPPPRDPSAACPPSWRCANTAARQSLGWEPVRGIFP